MPVKPLADCRLYAFVDAAYLRGRHPAALAGRLCEGGADLVQWRAKGWPPERVEAAAREILAVCAAHGVRLVINDHPRIAARIGAPLAHLGQEDFAGMTHVSQAIPAPDQAPSLAGVPAVPLGIGLSTHAPQQAERARAAGAAYVAVGPVYPTPTKPGRPAVTLDYVRWAAANLGDIPWFAIGGITLDTVDAVLAAGATRICVVSAILNHDDVRAPCRAFRDRL